MPDTETSIGRRIMAAIQYHHLVRPQQGPVPLEWTPDAARQIEAVIDTVKEETTLHAAFTALCAQVSIKRHFLPTDRYDVERRLGLANGWLQIDTPQDAPYFGQWTNPTTREIYSYTEGDHARVTCQNDLAYAHQIVQGAEWSLKHCGKKALVDSNGHMDVIARFTALGLQEFIH